MSNITVLIAEDHAIVRQGISSLLNAEDDIRVICEVGDGRKAIGNAKKLRPDVAIIDLAMPGLDGFETIKQIKRISSDTKIVVLTIYDDQGYMVEALRCGASAYLTKNAMFEDLATAVRAVCRGGVFMNSASSQDFMETCLKGASSIHSEGDTGLTLREREILRLIAEGHTAKEISETLCISERTVTTHRNHLMKKLGIHDRLGLMRFAITTGMITIPHTQ